MVNNEIGTIQPLREMAATIKKYSSHAKNLVIRYRFICIVTVPKPEITLS